MADEDYDELSTKREMVRLLAKEATGEQLDAAIHACLDNSLNDAERRTVLIQTIYGSWYDRVTKRPRLPGADFAPTWEDVQRMFLDVLAFVGAPRQPPQPTWSDDKSESQSVVPINRLSVGVPAHDDEPAVLEHIRRAVDDPPPQPASSDQKSDTATPIFLQGVAQFVP
jgi:hypothetical protein